ncbi:MAG TPA: SCP2 sterol-binding domain-containing protein [Acidimicrobiales bacterium]
MARFLSPSWVEELNAALEGAVLPDPAPDAGLAMVDGKVTVVQEVHGTPDGDVRLVMRIEAGTIRLHLAGRPARTGEGPAADAGDAPNVTIALSYEDAAALSKGELTPAEALNAGRIRVRGDLSALAAGQQLLSAARAAAGDLPPTTY